MLHVFNKVYFFTVYTQPKCFPSFIPACFHSAPPIGQCSGAACSTLTKWVKIKYRILLLVLSVSSQTKKTNKSLGFFHWYFILFYKMVKKIWDSSGSGSFHSGTILPILKWFWSRTSSTCHGPVPWFWPLVFSSDFRLVRFFLKLFLGTTSLVWNSYLGLSSPNIFGFCFASGSGHVIRLWLYILVLASFTSSSNGDLDSKDHMSMSGLL